MKIYVNHKEHQISHPLSLTELATKLHFTEPQQAVAASINGAPKDLSTTVQEGDHVLFYDFSDPKGKELFWHSSAHILAQAVLRLYPDAQPTIGPAIENGFFYDFANLKVSEEDFPKIEAEMEKIIQENHKPERVEFKNKEEALKVFGHNPYKRELIEEFATGSLSGYKQGEFFDLCRGPHLPTLGKVKAIKLLKTSGAYWRGDQQKEMLTRLYGISFPDKKGLKDYLLLLEEAKKRDHKKLGAELDLFSLKEEAPGLPFIHPKGLVIWNTLLVFLREKLAGSRYVEIKTPMIMGQGLWECSGHWDYYRENMYLSEIEGKQFAIKPMNCPGCMLFFKSRTHSYRDLPLRVAEIGHVHRFEASGALNGLFRVRGFHQDDAHLFMKKNEVKEEIVKCILLAEEIYMTFGLSFKLELSTRPAKSIGSDEDWHMATSGLKEALDEIGHSYRINEGDGAFYGPKIDFHIRDALGRVWQCGTIQLDFFLPERFELEYMDSDGKAKRPVMLHRAIFGSIERFLGILIEHFSGKFPFWLSPYQVRIIPVADRHVDRARQIQQTLEKASLICDVDDTNESVSKKIRSAQLLKVNYMLTIGDKELESGAVSLRTRDNVVHGEVSINDFLKKVLMEKETRALMSPYAIES